ncbi:HNH endonuclease [Bdellovibrio bacteriovorus]|uniref:HNH endonuclease n=1 Tax=Bdellovibrio bacteriovorus TaxID=959 RepID=UPI0035A6B6CA
MTKNLGTRRYFYIKSEDLNGLSDSDFVAFTIHKENFKVSVSFLRKRFAQSRDWNENGVHKQASSIPQWLYEANLVEDFVELEGPSISAVRAAQIWDILVEVAKAKATLTYGEIAARLGCHHRPLRYPLCYIQDKILEMRLPALNALAVNTKGLPGEGFIIGEVGKLEEIFEEVYAFNWDRIENPFSYVTESTQLEQAFVGIKKKLNPPKYYYSLIKTRGSHQMLFKNLLFDLYGGRCAFCGMTFHEALEAAHIIPWSECSLEDRIDPRNGLLLCANHHRLFDSGWFTLDDEHNIIYSDPQETKDLYTDTDRALSTKIHRSKILRPKEKDFWPSAKALEYHRKKHVK